MLKPSEIKKKTFTKAMRGYSIPEVDEYMDFVIEKYTELFRRNFELEQQLRAAIEQKGELEGEKEAVRGALVNAKKVSGKIIDTANTRAEAIIDSAKEGCNTILSDFGEQINLHRQTILELNEQVRTLKRELFEKYRQHIEELEKLTDITDKVKLKTSEEYMSEAIAKTEEVIRRKKQLAREKTPAAELEKTAENDAVTLDPDELFDSGDTVVFERVSDNDTSKNDDAATIVMDKVPDENN